MIAIDPRAGEAELRAEVLVVGSGAGGAVAAAELAKAGIDVLLLEAGPHHDPATFDQDEMSMLGRLYMDGGLRTTADQALVVMSGRGLGGSTIHNTGLCVPPSRALLEAWQREAGLPASVDALLAIAGEVLAALGAVPPPEASINRGNRILEAGAHALGLDAVRPLQNREACSGCGYCILGCAYNRKRHVLFSHLEAAVAAGLRIATGAAVDRIRRRGPSLELRGPGFRATAPRVVLAASALGTPALLLRSGIGPRRLIGRSLRLHPFAPVAGIFDDPVDAHRGIPQSVLVSPRRAGTAPFGAVPRNPPPSALGAGARATPSSAFDARSSTASPAALDAGPRPAPPTGADPTPRPDPEDPRPPWILMAAAAGPGATAALMPGLGPDVARRMLRYRHLAGACVLLHDASRGTVRARADGRPSIRYWPASADQDALRDGIATLARLHFAAGARTVLLPYARLPEISSPRELAAAADLPLRRYDLTLSSVHPQGSVPLGRDPARHPVAEGGQLRTAPGIFIADGSLFPSSAGIPPQVTIMTLVTAIARTMIADMRP